MQVTGLTDEAISEPTGVCLAGKQSLRQRLLKHMKGHYFRSVMLLASGAAMGQAVTLLSALLLARIYQPEHFGVLAVFAAVVAIFATVSALRYEMAIPLPKSELRASELLALSLAGLFTVVGLVSLLVWVLGELFIQYFKLELLGPYLWMLPMGILGAGFYQIFAAWVVRGRSYPQLAKASVVQAAGQAFCQIGFGVLGWGSFGLILGDVLGRASSGSMLCYQSLGGGGEQSWRQVTIGGIIRSAQRYWRFPAISSWAALLNAASAHSPLVLFALFYDLRIVGCLALAQRTLGAPTSLLCSSVSKVFLGECAAFHNKSPAGISRLFWKTVLSQASLSVGLLLFVALPAPWVFGWIFGEQWNLAGWCVLMLSMTYASKMIAFPLAPALDVLERQGLHMLREIVRLFLTGTAILLAACYGLGPLAAVAALSLASSLAYGFGIGIVWYAIGQRSESYAT